MKTKETDNLKKNFSKTAKQAMTVKNGKSVSDQQTQVFFTARPVSAVNARKFLTTAFPFIDYGKYDRCADGGYFTFTRLYTWRF